MNGSSSELVVSTVPRRPCRIQYVKGKGRMRRYVIVDFFADGAACFADQFSGEVRWHPFEPSREEREAVERLLKARQSDEIVGPVHFTLGNDDLCEAGSSSGPKRLDHVMKASVESMRRSDRDMPQSQSRMLVAENYLG